MGKRPVVAIDGPAGAGKSTVACGLAHRFHFTLIDTGAIYRAVALAAKHAQVEWTDASRMGALAFRLVDRKHIEFRHDEQQGTRIARIFDLLSERSYQETINWQKVYPRWAVLHRVCDEP